MNESCAMSVNDEVPSVVGVPERTPAGLRVRPGGGVPELVLHVSGVAVLDAVKAKLYGRLTAPEGGAGVALMTGGGGSTMTMGKVAAV